MVAPVHRGAGSGESAWSRDRSTLTEKRAIGCEPSAGPPTEGRPGVEQLNGCRRTKVAMTSTSCYGFARYSEHPS